MQRGLKIVIWTICVVHLLSRLIVYCYQKVNYQWFDYEAVQEGLKILNHRMTQAIILYCLIMVILINGYGDENDSDLYVPARNRKISKIIASVTNKTYTKAIQKLEQWGTATLTHENGEGDNKSRHDTLIRQPNKGEGAM